MSNWFTSELELYLSNTDNTRTAFVQKGYRFMGKYSLKLSVPSSKPCTFSEDVYFGFYKTLSQAKQVGRLWVDEGIMPEEEEEEKGDDDGRSRMELTGLVWRAYNRKPV